MKVLVCDDKNEQLELTKNVIGANLEPTGLAGPDLKCELTKFFRWVSTVLNGDSSDCSEVSATVFDKFDLVILDNNLTELEMDGARLTAETIIGYLRAFTDIAYIVSLNKNPHVDFDLRFLFGDYQSLADLALNTKHLSLNHLWKGTSNEDFAPWYWPRIATAVDRRKKQIVFLNNYFEQPVWKALNFPQEADDYLSFHAKSALSTDNALNSSFQVFVDRSRTLSPGELVEISRLAAKGSELAQKAIRRITAFEVDRWLRRDVLGPQDVLIDIPHLLAQMPFLAGEKTTQFKHWNEIVKSEEPPFGFDSELFDKHLEPTLFAESYWMPTPCFWWPKIKSDEGLSELYYGSDGNWPNAVFCEDISRFVLVSSERDLDGPQEFEAEIAGSWARRFVVNSPDYQYSPRNRILGSLQ